MSLKQQEDTLKKSLVANNITKNCAFPLDGLDAHVYRRALPVFSEFLTATGLMETLLPSPYQLRRPLVAPVLHLCQTSRA